MVRSHESLSIVDHIGSEIEFPQLEPNGKTSNAVESIEPANRFCSCRKMLPPPLQIACRKEALSQGCTQKSKSLVAKTQNIRGMRFRPKH